MPEMPVGDGGWPAWIITSTLAALSGAIGGIVTLARMIQGQYQQTIETLKSELGMLKNDYKEIEKTFNTKYKELEDVCDAQWKEISDCKQDRAALKARMEISDRERAEIKARVFSSEQKIDTINSGN